VKLEAHGWSLELLPALGGAIGRLRHAGHDILRPTAPGAKDPLEAACFPLVPYANRIAGGRFAFEGRQYQLPLNFGDHPHSLHGIGWQSAWQVASCGDDGVVLGHEHAGDAGWPWAYRAEQRLTLAPGALRARLSLTNLAQCPAPAGLGFHPYFPAGASTRLTFTAARLWEVDATILPTIAAAADHLGDWSIGDAVSGDRLIDNSYEGWDGIAVVEQVYSRCRMTATGATALHLYRPPGLPFFCIEPVDHLPDAINRVGMPVLSPGATRTLEMTLNVDV
jgi:aldose 1-epimerase